MLALALLAAFGWQGGRPRSVRVAFVLWLMLMWKAYNGAEWEAPIAGPFARKMVPQTPGNTTPLDR